MSNVETVPPAAGPGVTRVRPPHSTYFPKITHSARNGQFWSGACYMYTVTHNYNF